MTEGKGSNLTLLTLDDLRATEIAPVKGTEGKPLSIVVSQETDAGLQAHMIGVVAIRAIGGRLSHQLVEIVVEEDGLPKIDFPHVGHHRGPGLLS